MLHDWYWLIVVVLAVFRLTGIVTVDAIADRPRDWILERGGKLAELVSCSWCVSVWVALVCTLLTYGGWEWWRWTAFGLAASGATGILSTLTER